MLPARGAQVRRWLPVPATELERRTPRPERDFFPRGRSVQASSPHKLFPFRFTRPRAVFLFRTRGGYKLKFISTVKFYCISGPQDLHPRRDAGQPGRLPPYLRFPRRTRGHGDTRLWGGAGRKGAGPHRLLPHYSPTLSQVSVLIVVASTGWAV